MSIRIDSFSSNSFPTPLDREIKNKTESTNTNEPAKFDPSAISDFHAFAGQMRKLQLLQKFASVETSNNKTININLAIPAKPLDGDDDEIRKETQRLIENFRRQIKSKEIKGSQPAAIGKPSGHADAKHRVKPEVQAEIVNNPDRIFSGKRINRDGSERYVDIYYKNGSAVITEQGDKGRVITGYGLIDKKTPNPKPFNLEKITNNPNYVEIKLEKLGSTNVVYPNKPRFEANDFRALERRCESRNYYNYIDYTLILNEKRETIS